MGADLEYIARLDASQVRKELAKVDKDIDKLAKDADRNFKQLGSGLDKDMSSVRQRQAAQYRELGAAAATAFGVISTYSLTAVGDAREAIAAELQLTAAIESTGGAAGQTLETLTAHAGALQDISLYSDDAIMEAQGLLLQYENLKKIFPEATEVMLDFAQRTGKDLGPAAKELGKILNIPTEATAKLKKLGIELTAQQKEQIKAFVEAGDVYSAQKIILDELQKTYGGAAQAARDAAGPQKDLEVSTGELSEAWGRLILSIGDAGATGALVGFLDTLAEGADAWTATIERIQAAQAALGELKPSFDLTIEDINRLTTGLVELNPFVILTNGVQGFYQALKEGKGFFEAWRKGLEAMLAGVQDLVSSTLSIFSNVDENLTNRPIPTTPTPRVTTPITTPTPSQRGPVPVGTSHGPPRPRQRGGNVIKAFPYYVGEKGPELFVPNTGGTIVPNKSLMMPAITQRPVMSNVQNIRQGPTINVPDAAGLLGNPVVVRQIRNLIISELDRIF